MVDLAPFGGPRDTAWRTSLDLPAYNGHTTREWAEKWRARRASEMIFDLWTIFLTIA